MTVLTALQNMVHFFSVHPSLRFFVNGAGDVSRPWLKRRKFSSKIGGKGSRQHFPLSSSVPTFDFVPARRFLAVLPRFLQLRHRQAAAAMKEKAFPKHTTRTTHTMNGFVDAHTYRGPFVLRVRSTLKRRFQEPAACRTYDYMGEAACDARLMTFLICVRAVRDQTPGGFAAVKLTALGDPVLLSQITTCSHVSRRFMIQGVVVAGLFGRCAR